MGVHMPRYTMYKRVLERFGLKQLDVYRYRDRDVVRAVRVVDGSILLIELPKHREEMSVEEFTDHLRSKILR